MKRMPDCDVKQRIRSRRSHGLPETVSLLRIRALGLRVAVGTIILMMGCGQEEPNSGALRVLSDPDSAGIMLDGVNTGRITPSLLADISPGDHVVAVRRESFVAVPESSVVLVLPSVADSVHFELIPEGVFGAIFVTSTPESAFILLDGANTGSLTPDTLVDVPTGNHSVRVTREGYVASPESIMVLVRAGVTSNAVFQLTAATGRPVLLESFTNTSCEPCAEANPMMYELLDELGPNQAILMEFHTSFPSPLDPFYLAQRTLMDRRITHYGVTQAPWVVIEGTDGIQPVSRDVVASAIENAEPADDVTLALEGELTGTTLSCSLTVSTTGEEGRYRLSVFVTHDRIEFDEPPGSNGETLFRHVVRAGLTPVDGTEIDVTAGEEKLGWVSNLEWLEEGETIVVVAVASPVGVQRVTGIAVQQLP